MGHAKDERTEEMTSGDSSNGGSNSSSSGSNSSNNKKTSKLPSVDTTIWRYELDVACPLYVLWPFAFRSRLVAY